MADIIVLTPEKIPDCKICTAPSKRIIGKTMDLEGPGKVGIVYGCDNKSCRRKKNNAMLFWLRREGLI